MDDDDKDKDVTKLISLGRTPGEHERRSPPRVTTKVRPKKSPRIIDPGTKIRSLECFPEVHKMVSEGVFLRAIIRHIRNKGEMVGIPDSSVLGMLRDYKNFLLSDAAFENQAPVVEVNTDEPAAVLRELQRKFQQMSQRIDMEVQTEQNLNKLFSNTYKEFLSLNTLGKDILKHQMALGMMGNSSTGGEQVHGDGTPGRLDVSQVVSNPESRHRVLDLVETLIGDDDLMDSLISEGKVTDEKPKPKRKKVKGKRAKQTKAEKALKKAAEKAVSEGVVISAVKEAVDKAIVNSDKGNLKI